METIMRMKQKAAKTLFFVFCFFAFLGIAGADVIIDNGASGTSFTGTWTASTGAGYFGTNSLFARPDATYTWQFNSQPAGTYEVLLWWTQTDTRGDAIAVSIATADGPVSATVNQRTNGGQWNSLGNFNLASSAGVTITASSQLLSDGRYVSTGADAVWFRQVSGNPGIEQVKDNGDSRHIVYRHVVPFERRESLWRQQLVRASRRHLHLAIRLTDARDLRSIYVVDRRHHARIGHTRRYQRLGDGERQPACQRRAVEFSGHLHFRYERICDHNGGRHHQHLCGRRQAWYPVDLNAAPTATIDSINPNPAGFDAFVAFSGHGTAGGGATIAEYRWESSIDGLLGTEASFSAGPLTLGSHTISFTVTDSNGEVSEVAQQQLVIENPVITIDNGGPGTSSTGTWSVSTGPNPYGSNSLYARPTATYTWQFASQPAGLYDVYIWYTATSTRASAVPVNINGLETVTIDQRTGGGQWNYLGTYAFNGSGYVTVTAVGTASTCADAVRFEYVSGINPPGRPDHFDHAQPRGSRRIRLLCGPGQRHRRFDRRVPVDLQHRRAVERSGRFRCGPVPRRS